jgi:tRNA G18 (ribose-2'-O)-methylase SpoU
MSPIIELDDIKDPRISSYYSMKGKDLSHKGLFVAESEKAIENLLLTDIEIESFLTSDVFYRRRGKAYLLNLSKKGIPVYVGKVDDLDSIIGYRFHQGILAIAREPRRKTIEEIMADPKKKEKHLIVALNGIHDPQNVGLIARNAAAFGATALMTDKRTCNPYYRKSARVAIGYVYSMPVSFEPELAPKLRWLRENCGTKIIVACPGRKNKLLENIDPGARSCVVFGNEGEGVESAVSRAADIKVKIPIAARVDSLNVGCSSAIFLYKAYVRGKRRRA